MSHGGYKIRDQSATYFITFAVVNWVDVFTRKEYRDIVVESIRYCQQEKGMILYGWCLMSNHVHMIVSAKFNNLSGMLRDFKKYTSKQIIQAIAAHPRESRKEWMLDIFSSAGKANKRNSEYQFWQQDNEPKQLFSRHFTEQKLDYIHNNPVVAAVVDKAEEYLYSSARNYYYGKNCGVLDIAFLS